MYKSAHVLTSSYFYNSFLTVTEREVTQGMFSPGSTPSDTSVVITRRLTNISHRLHDVKAYRFIDLDQPGSIDTEAQSLLSQLRDKRVAEVISKSNHIECELAYEDSAAIVVLDRFHDNIDVTRTANELRVNVEQLQRHVTHLRNLCNNFLLRMKRMIGDAHEKQRRFYDELTSEVLQHWHLAKTRCHVFEGRAQELGRIEAYCVEESVNLSSNAPVVVYGHSGCGKTSVLAKVCDLLASGSWLEGNKRKYDVILRFMGTTPHSCDLHQLLVSLCQQLAEIYSKKFSEPEKITDLISEFH